MAVVRYRDENGNIVPLRVIQGDNGEQMFVRFSEYADGTDMSETWDDKRDYMGIAFGYKEPTNKADYQWIRVSHFPNGMSLDADNNLHVSGEEITFGQAALKAVTSKKGKFTGTGSSVTFNFDFVPKFIYIQCFYTYMTTLQGSYTEITNEVWRSYFYVNEEGNSHAHKLMRLANPTGDTNVVQCSVTKTDDGKCITIEGNFDEERDHYFVAIG